MQALSVVHFTMNTNKFLMEANEVLMKTNDFLMKILEVIEVDQNEFQQNTMYHS